MRITREQQKIIDEFEGHWCFDFMYKDEIDDPKSFFDAFQRNQQWILDHASESDRFITDYYNEHFDEIER